MPVLQTASNIINTNNQKESPYNNPNFRSANQPVTQPFNSSQTANHPPIFGDDLHYSSKAPEIYDNIPKNLLWASNLDASNLNRPPNSQFLNTSIGTAFNRVTVKVMKADMLKDNDGIGKMDPYCKIKIGQALKKTTSKSGAGKTPVWNESLVFGDGDKNIDPYGIVIIQVFDNDTISDDFCGSCEITLKDIQSYMNNKKDWHNLYSKNRTDLAGKIY